MRKVGGEGGGGAGTGARGGGAGSAAAVVWREGGRVGGVTWRRWGAALQGPPHSGGLFGGRQGQRVWAPANNSCGRWPMETPSGRARRPPSRAAGGRRPPPAPAEGARPRLCTAPLLEGAAPAGVHTSGPHTREMVAGCCDVERRSRTSLPLLPRWGHPHCRAPPPHPYQCGLSLCAREAKGRVTDGHEGDSPRQCTRWPDPRAAPPRAGTSCRGAPPAAPQTHRTTAAARAAAGRPAAQPAARREPSLPSGNARERQTSSPPRLAPPLLVIARLALPPLPPHPPPIPAGGSITRPPPPQYA